MDQDLRLQDAPQVKYVPPELTLAALEEVALHTLSPASLAADQATCPTVKDHKMGRMPKNVKMGHVQMSDVILYCEVSDPKNPRPLVPANQRTLVANLLHHADHAGQKEMVRRVSKDYYWPGLRKDVSAFVKSCHPCQLAKQSRTVSPGIGQFDVPDKRFSFIHLDIVGPLPVSEGYKFLLTIYDRCSRWTEAYPLARDSSEEVCRAFMEWTSRFGLCQVAMSDNGNAFVANLFQDVLKSFGVEVRFSPVYHPATNGAIERKHQDIKNALKAALVEMGNVHRDQWIKALPWVILGRRVSYQPSLDASAAQMVLNMSPVLPGQLVGHPGPPLNTTQLRALLDRLYRMADRPPVQTSGKKFQNDITSTESATHVYVKVDKPASLCPKFEGPYEIVARPSRSTVTVKVGVSKSGELRTLNYHWSSCKVAHMREDATEASRPKLGRRPKLDVPAGPDPSVISPAPQPPEPGPNLQAKKRAKNSTTTSTEKVRSDHHDTLSGKPPHPGYIEKGPLITQKMFDDADWPKILNLPSTRPIRSSRNQSPNYVDSLSVPMGSIAFQ